eukprot:TRINITY_DN13064_c1_g1_i1.p3 TRINITY_DN13064_c1_g1~~TRINITY_DN13064_c1_g1_i1.p3  ORF type:complete len:173 (-),score=18.53 TRINITY_DN13064_c1_g1_i1:1522-2040(-)
MALYCGCKTKGNRIKWTIFVVFLVQALVFTIAYLAVQINAAKTLFVCTVKSDEEDKSQGQASIDQAEQKCTDGYVATLPKIYILLIVAVVWYIACTIPLYIMCCCTNPPKKVDMYDVAAMHQVSQTSYGYPVAGHVVPTVPRQSVVANTHRIETASVGNEGNDEKKPLLDEP